MSSGILRYKWAVCIASTLLLAVLSLTASAKDEKLKPEEIVNKNLAAIGTQEARAAVKSRIVSGTADVVFRLGGHGQMQGKGNMLSEGQKTRISMIFGGLDYPGEHLAYDANKVTVGQVRPGERSALSSFVYLQTTLMKEGLLGGTLSTAWALLDNQGRQGRLDYNGLKKIEGKQLHEVKYRPKKGPGDLTIFLYFEPETFRHVRSQYRMLQPPPMATTPTESSSMRDTIYLLVEQFDDFKSFDGITLPQSYKISFTIEGMGRTFLADWLMKTGEVIHNQEIDPKYFVAQ
jgi:hypothetical protein